jgi:hypothetical protein
MFALILPGFMAIAQRYRHHLRHPAQTRGGTGIVDGGAPIGSGMVLLIVMAAGYGGKKVFDFRKVNLAD